jgi:hypothetical protein
MRGIVAAVVVVVRVAGPVVAAEKWCCAIRLYVEIFIKCRSRYSASRALLLYSLSVSGPSGCKFHNSAAGGAASRHLTPFCTERRVVEAACARAHGRACRHTDETPRALLQKVSFAVDMDSIRSALQKGVNVYELFEKANQVSRDYDPGCIATESSLKIDPKQSKWIYQRLATTSCEWLVRIFSTLLLSRCALLV